MRASLAFARLSEANLRAANLGEANLENAWVRKAIFIQRCGRERPGHCRVNRWSDGLTRLLHVVGS